MKLVLAVLNKDDTKSVIQELMRGGFSVTKLSSAGGFLRAGTTTILCGMKDERVEKALEIIKTYSCKKVYSPSRIPNETKSIFNMDKSDSRPSEIVMGGASVFVLNIEQFEKY